MVSLALHKQAFAESRAISAMNRNLFFNSLQSNRAAPPRYTTLDAGPSASISDGDPTAPYHLEQLRLPVGGTVPKAPFVPVSQLKVHLGPLRAFRELRNRVTDLGVHLDVREKLPPLAQELEPQERWTWFLELPLERFALCNSSA